MCLDNIFNLFPKRDLPLDHTIMGTNREEIFQSPISKRLAGKKVIAVTVCYAFKKERACNLSKLKESINKIENLGISQIILILPTDIKTAIDWNNTYGDRQFEIWADCDGKLKEALHLGRFLRSNQDMEGYQSAVIGINNGLIQSIQVEIPPGEHVIQDIISCDRIDTCADRLINNAP